MVAVFAIKLTAGITLMWLLMPRKEVTDGFFRIQMLVALGLSVLAALAIDPATFGICGSPDHSLSGHVRSVSWLPWFRAALIALAVTAYAGHVFWKLGRRTPGVICIGLCGVLSLGLVAGRALLAQSAASAVLVAVSDMSSATVLGSTLTGMLLGHWYLTTPTMSIRPLFWFAIAVGVAGTVRLLVSAASLALNGQSDWSGVNGMWLAMRLIGGVLVPQITAVLVINILRYRNTQSATGVLFAALILVFMGEMAGTLLERESGLPY
jgi:hypothetical protein